MEQNTYRGDLVGIVGLVPVSLRAWNISALGKESAKETYSPRTDKRNIGEAIFQFFEIKNVVIPSFSSSQFDISTLPTL